MDYWLEFDAQHRIVLLAFQNDVTEGLLLDADSALAAFAKDNPSISGGIFDFSRVRALHVSGISVRKLVESRPVNLPGRHRAIVAPGAAVFGYSRMFQILRELAGDHLISVVRSMPEAWHFLGLDSPQFRVLDSRTGRESVSEFPSDRIAPGGPE